MILKIDVYIIIALINEYNCTHLTFVKLLYAENPLKTYETLISKIHIRFLTCIYDGTFKYH